MLILLEDTNLVEDVLQVAERIQGEVAKPFVLDDQTVQNSLSIGIVMSCDYSSADELIRAADLAMYQAKTRGQADQVSTEAFDRTLASSNFTNRSSH